MRIKILTFTLFFTCLGFIHAQETASVQVSKTAETKIDSVSYGLGVLLAGNIKQQGFDEIDAPSLVEAIQHVLNGQDTRIEPAQANAIIQKYMADKQAVQFIEVKKAGEVFLAENAKRPEVKTTESGLQYEILMPGNGLKPTPSNKVSVHYHGTLIDGTVFDSSVERGSPATFGVTQVIQGWVEGLQLMPLGAKYKFYIPYNLAYGERAAGAKIQPYSALIFEVELLEIQ